MKKLLSIVLSIVMLLSVGMATLPAFAADNVVSPESTTQQNKITVQVNGKVSTEVTYERDPENPRKITFTYTGDGKLIGWEFPGMEEGVDYKIVSRDGNSITIEISEDYDGEVIANAIVEEEGKPVPTTKKSTSPTSPKTGAMAASGIVAMGAGAAILAAMKKKEDEE